MPPRRGTATDRLLCLKQLSVTLCPLTHLYLSVEPLSQPDIVYTSPCLVVATICVSQVLGLFCSLLSLPDAGWALKKYL